MFFEQFRLDGAFQTFHFCLVVGIKSLAWSLKSFQFVNKISNAINYHVRSLSYWKFWAITKILNATYGGADLKVACNAHIRNEIFMRLNFHVYQKLLVSKLQAPSDD